MRRRDFAAVAAIKEKGVLSGKRIERREVGRPGELKGWLMTSWSVRWSSSSVL
jgi:hypothetical protein